MIYFLISLAFAVDPLNDLTTFPKWPQYNFKTYSGFIPVAQGARSLHYVYLESQSNPATDPVVLWLNGGPGCSSLLGLLTEIGPFMIPKGETEFQSNPYAWNLKANVIFLESPSGVGFSPFIQGYAFTEDNTGSDNADAVRNFLIAFNLLDKPFFITGESYAGMYIPYTAKWIQLQNALNDVKVNLQGIMIGNGRYINNAQFKQQAMWKYYLRRSFVDPQTQKQLLNQCSINLNSITCQLAIQNYEKVCKQSNINPYNVYGYCYQDNVPQALKTANYRNSQSFEFESIGAAVTCSDDAEITVYLNDQATKTALHVTGDWVPCSDQVGSGYKKDAGSVSILKELAEAGIKILLFSGDQDAVVSVVDTEETLQQFPGIKQLTSWTAFGRTDDLQLAGWKTQYNYLDFIVIRGAGHMVPSDQPKSALQMFSEFLQINNLRE